MPQSCEPNDLSTAANCIKSRIESEMMEAVKVYLLAVIAGVDPDPEALVEASQCISERMSDHQLKAAMVYLECQILNK